MKKQQIRKLAISIIEAGEISENVSQWIFKNLTKSEMKLLVSYMSCALKETTVVARYAGTPSTVTKEKIQKMFPDKKLVYIRDDKEIGAGIRFEFGDYVLDYTVTNMILKIMKDIRESL